MKKYELLLLSYVLCIILVLTLPLCQDLHVISTDENRVVAAVQEWNQNETYNLYVSDTSGVYYTLALENVVSSMGPEGNVMVDLYEVNIHPSFLPSFLLFLPPLMRSGGSRLSRVFHMSLATFLSSSWGTQR